MAGLWRKNPETYEGKYPIVLRRDGTPLQSRFLVMTLKDPCFPAAIAAYANKAEEIGLDPQYVAEIRQLGGEADIYRNAVGAGDPDAPRHRKDDPTILAWARSIGCPGS
jgi:hypothetical protein